MSMNDITKCYETLGLKPEASLDEVKEAYRDLVKVWHPDRFAQDPKLQLKAQEKLKEINEAYQKIQDFLENLSAYQQATKKTTEKTSDSITPTNADTEQASAPDKEGKDHTSQQQPESPSASSHTQTSQQVIRPWVRYWARNLDLLLLSIPPGFLFGFLLSIIAPKFLMRIIEGGDYVFAFFVLPFAVLTEAMVIALFGNTPGKAILKTKITNAEGKSLSLIEALKRSFSMYLYGYALGIPLIPLFTYLWQYKKLKKIGRASWDSKFGFNVTHAHIGGVRIASYVVLFLCLIIVVGIIKVATKEATRTGSPVKPQAVDWSQFTPVDESGNPLSSQPKQAIDTTQALPRNTLGLHEDAGVFSSQPLNPIMLEFEPFMLNLAEQGRFLKMTLQIELAHPGYRSMVAGKMPQLRDAIGTLVSGKSVESLSGTEGSVSKSLTYSGKAQLKDELLLRINMTIGKDAIKAVYFTEFTML